MNSLSQNITPETQSTSPKNSGGVMGEVSRYFGGALAAVAGLVAIENSALAQETKPKYVRTGEILGRGVIHDTNCCGSASTTVQPQVVTLPSTTATARGGDSTVVQPPIIVTTIPAPTNSPASSTNPIPVNTAPSAKACPDTTFFTPTLVKPKCQPTFSIERGAASLISTTYIPTSAGTVVDINGPRVGKFTGSASGANDIQQLRHLAGVREENIVRTVLSEQSIWRAIHAPLPGVAVNQTFIRETVYKTCAGQETSTRTMMQPACTKNSPWCGCGKH